MDNVNFKYPYDFVRIDTRKIPKRRDYRKSNPFHIFSGISGKIKIKVKAETPLFIRHKPQTKLEERQQDGNKHPWLFCYHVNEDPRDREYHYYIPGTSFKGLIRSTAEAAGNSCFSLFSGKYENCNYRIPDGFRGCNNKDNLCITCRIFGMQSGNGVSMGKINISDLKCTKAVEMSELILPILGSPKPRHKNFYEDENKPGMIAGRKFYFHRPSGIIRETIIVETRRGVQQNFRVKPLDKDSIFYGKVSFENLSEDELDLLIYSLVLNKNMRHKIGMGKPAGFGSIKVSIKKMELYDYRKKFSSNPDDRRNWINVMENVNLTNWINDRTRNYRNNQTSINLLDLRRIWTWNPNDKENYHYPPQHWFREHGNVKLSEINPR